MNATNDILGAPTKGGNLIHQHNNPEEVVMKYNVIVTNHSLSFDLKSELIRLLTAHLEARQGRFPGSQFRIVCIRETIFIVTDSPELLEQWALVEAPYVRYMLGLDDVSNECIEGSGEYMMDGFSSSAV